MTDDNKYIRLSELGADQEGVVIKVYGHGSFRHRVMEMGFIRGKVVRVIKKAPLQDPVEYEIMGYRVALRRSEAEMIEVDTNIDRHVCDNQNQVTETELGTKCANRFLHPAVNVINVALVGNPNCGKTSLFNLASGLNERVGNYSGVTVGSKMAQIQHNRYKINLSDLPGTYSITEYSPEELYVRTHLSEQMPDVVINVVDASNLERNMLLTTQLIDMNLKVVIALNMYDELEESGAKFDHTTLGRMIGIPIIPTVASKNIGMDALLDKVIDVFEDNEPTVRHIHINYGVELEHSIALIQNEIWKNSDIVARYSSRFLAIKLLEDDSQITKTLSSCHNYKSIVELSKKEILRLEKIYGDKPETIITSLKYGFIAGALGETLKLGKKKSHSTAQRIDRILTDKWLGFPAFLLIMWIMFQTTFSLGQYPSDWLESAFAMLSDYIGRTMSDGTLKELLTDGVIHGVGGVIVFLPNILILFLFISIMEDTGYMSRAAFIMDRLMHKIGLHGKSFMPLLMGFGCNVPAIMATRTLESRKDRLLTMMIIPFMSCSARLPVYVLLISAFFPHNQGLVLVSIYVIGVVIGVLSAIMLRKTLFKGADVPFVMELPPYRIPTGRSVVKHMWNKGEQYLRKMGSIILLASIIIWSLGHYPKDVELSKDYDSLRNTIESSVQLTPGAKQTELKTLSSLERAERQEKSYIGRIGHAIEPVIRPLGFDWQIGVSLATGLVAKEIVVSTMAVLSGTSDDHASISQNLQKQTHSSGPHIGEQVFSPLVAYAMMIFILLYFPCVAVIAAIKREAGFKWALFTIFYTTSLAWLLSFAVYQIGSLFA